MMRMVVVLPAPFGPRQPKMSPGSTAKLTSVSTCRPDRRLDTPSKLMDAAIVSILM